MARVVGLDLGSHTVKAVLFETTMRGHVVKEFHTQPRAQEGEKLETLKSAVQALFTAHPMMADQVVVALPGALLATHTFQMPFTDAKRLEAALPFEVESQLPFDLDDAVYDYQLTGQKDKKSDLLVGVIRKNELNALMAALSDAKIEPRIVTHPAVAYQSFFLAAPGVFGANDGSSVAIVDIGHERTCIAIGKPGVGIEFARTFQGGGKDLTRALAAEFNTALPDAEQWKLQHAALGSQVVGPDAERAAGAFIRGLQPIIREIRATLKGFTGRTKSSVSTIYLVGGTAKLLGIDEQLSRDLGMTVKLLPLPPEAATIDTPEHPLAGQPYALALRGSLSGAKAPRFNYRRGDFAFKGDFDYVKDKVGRLAGFGLILLLLFIASGFVRNSLLNRREKQVTQMLCDVTMRVLGKCETDFNIAVSLLEGKASPAAAVPKYSAANLLAELTAKVPNDTPVTFDRIVIDLDRITLQGQTDSSKQIDRITSALKTYKCFREVKEGKVEKSKDGQHVNFRLDIQVECPEAGSDTNTPAAG